MTVEKRLEKLESWRRRGLIVTAIMVGGTFMLFGFGFMWYGINTILAWLPFSKYQSIVDVGVYFTIAGMVLTGSGFCIAYYCITEIAKLKETEEAAEK